MLQFYAFKILLLFVPNYSILYYIFSPFREQRESISHTPACSSAHLITIVTKRLLLIIYCIIIALFKFMLYYVILP